MDTIRKYPEYARKALAEFLDEEWKDGKVAGHELGVTRQTVSNWRVGETMPTYDVMQKLIYRGFNPGETKKGLFL